MKSKILIYVNDPQYIKDYCHVGVSAFLFGLDAFCVGYRTYSLEEINKVNVSNKYILLNRVLDCASIDNLRELLPRLEGVKGIVFEDVGVYQLVLDMHLSYELILFQNHFATNSASVSFWLDRVDSVMLGNELTKEEILPIVENAKRKVCLHLFGYNQVMYSRRLLLSNWSKEFSIPYQDQNIIEDVATHVRFRAYENAYGTVMYSDKIYNGNSLYEMDNVYYYYVNTMLLSHSVIMDFLKQIKTYTSDACDTGFLSRETIYKLKER